MNWRVASFNRPKYLVVCDRIKFGKFVCNATISVLNSAHVV